MWSLHWTENPEERDRNPSAPQKIYASEAEVAGGIPNPSPSGFDSYHSRNKLQGGAQLVEH